MMKTNSKPFIVGFSGKLNAGKDFSAKLLQSMFISMYGQDDFGEDIVLRVQEKEQDFLGHYSDCNVTYFAKRLKKACSESTGIPLHFFYDEKLKMEKLDPPFDMYSPRTLMTTFGDKCREIADNFFSDTLLNDYKPNQRLLIPDVRFENEVNAIEKHGGIVIRVERGLKYRHGFEALEDVARYEPDLYQKLTHRSETSLDNYEFEYKVVWQDDPWEIVEDLRLIMDSHFGIKFIS